MDRYFIQEAAEKLEEILAKVRAGEKVVLSDQGEDVAEIRPIRRVTKTGDPQADALQELIAEGIIVPAEAKPEALARFLASRD
jgi:antitoxin (DNA-binding transcriptional repressor) of toxin-antitoxin stability system